MKSKTLIKIIATYSIIFLFFLSIATFSSDASGNDKAIIKMALLLNLIWCIGFGFITFKFKDKIKSIFQNVKPNWNWKTKFFLFFLFLILFEEIITTILTNLAQVLGGEIGKSFITASTNYFEVIFFHSAIMFVPFIFIWTYLFSKYSFNPNQAFLLFGLLGTLSETLLSPFALISGFWFFVYGLMIYLPAYTLPIRENLQTPDFKAYLIALILPFIVSIPMSLFVIWLRGVFGIELFV
jgi:hypothetical protein